MLENGIAGSHKESSRSEPSLRPLALSLGLLSRADGSARFAFGPVEVLGAATGPQEVRLKDELLDRATLEVNVLPVRGLAGPSSKSLQATLQLLLSPLILLHAHPRSLIQLTLQTTSLPSLRFSKSFRAFAPSAEGAEEDDGSDDETAAEEEASAAEMACALNAGIAALIDASISMRGLAAAVAVSMSGTSRQARNIILDPTPRQQRDAIATFVIGFSFGEGLGGKEGQMIWCESCGTSKGGVDDDVLSECIATANVACRAIIAFLRKSVERKFSQAVSDPAPSSHPVPSSSMEEG